MRARRTRATVRQLNVHEVDESTAAFDAITVTDVLEHIPDPVRVLTRVARLLAPGGWTAVKVPSGPGQLRKEQWRGRLFRGYRPTLADNLVHVNHFSPRSLRIALERAGFCDIVHHSRARPSSRPDAACEGRLSDDAGVDCTLPRGLCPVECIFQSP